MEKNFIENVLSSAQDYIDAKIDLIMLNLAEKGANIIQKIVLGMLTIFFLGIALLLVVIGLAIVLGQYVGGVAYGFLIMAGVLLLVMFIIRNVVKKAIKNKIFTIVTENFNDDGDGK